MRDGRMRRPRSPNVFPVTAPGKEKTSVVTAPGRGSREEKSVPKWTDGTSHSPGQEFAAPPLPDLRGVTLRMLKTCDDAAVTAAVESALHTPEALSRVWRSTGGQGGSGKRETAAARVNRGGMSGGRDATSGGRGAFRSTCGPGGDSTGHDAAL